MPVEINGLTSSHSQGRQKADTAKGSANNSASKDASTSVESGTKSDTVQISSAGISLQKLEENASSLPEVDTNRVNKLITAIENGSYKPNAENIAAKMLKFEEML